MGDGLGVCPDAIEAIISTAIQIDFLLIMPASLTLLPHSGEGKFNTLRFCRVGILSSSLEA
jgi:hypothetical protein